MTENEGPDRRPVGVAGSAAAGFRYVAFLSYSHRDRRWARWLHRSLEAYRTPRRLVGKPGPAGPVPARLAPVFRDRDELPSSADLDQQIRAALAESEALVVICSPAAAQSRWVNEEILSFRRLGRSARVFCLVVEGEPNSGDHDTECFPPAVRLQIGPEGQLTDEPVEPIAADARPEGDSRKRAFLRVAAGILGVGYDDLVRRDMQRRQRRMMAITAASLSGMLVTLGLAAAAVLARQDAERRRDQADHLIGFMVGDLRSKLEAVGRLDILDAVGDESMAYFGSLEPRDIDDDVLSLQAKALTQIGEVRTQQGRYDGALRAFQEAHRRALALTNREPLDAARLFDRGQAEYWVGYVRWRQGDLTEAGTWMEKYLDTSRRLVALNPARTDWLRELAYAEHNMAVIELDRGDARKALAAFERERRVLSGLLEEAPANGELRFDLADAYSWMGSAMERLCDLRGAKEHFAAQRREMIGVLKSHPDQIPWRYDLALATAHEGRMVTVLGDLGEARNLIDEAIRILEELVGHDPENGIWQAFLALYMSRRARLLASEGNAAAAIREADAAVEAFDRLAKIDESDVIWLRYRVEALWAAATARVSGGDPDAARPILRRSISLVPEPGNDMTQRDVLVAHVGQALVLLGDIEARGGNRDEAAALWREAHDTLAPVAESGEFWQLLDPWARALMRLGEDGKAAKARETLGRAGYVPLDPWIVQSHPESRVGK